MPEIQEYTVDSLKSYAEILQDCLDAGDPLWFRGVNCSSYPLIPGLYRKTGHEEGDFRKFEKEIGDWFQHRSAIFLDKQHPEERDLIFLLQHYRVPTRLLDWTENPFIALFFALIKPNSGKAPAVWILNPTAWNKHIAGYKDRIPSYTEEALDQYSITLNKEIFAEKPLAIYGRHNNARIAAQRGVFTIFGKFSTAMDELYKQNTSPQNCLKKITVNIKDIERLNKQISAIGYTHSVVFPDLEGLALEIRRKFGFEV